MIRVKADGNANYTDLIITYYIHVSHHHPTVPLNMYKYYESIKNLKVPYCIANTQNSNVIICCHCQVLCSVENCTCCTFTWLEPQRVCSHQHYHRHWATYAQWEKRSCVTCFISFNAYNKPREYLI